MGWRATTLTIAFIIGVAAPGRAEQPADPLQPRTTMHEIFLALSYLLPTSLDEDRFTDPARRSEILYWLDQLVDSSVALEKHSKDRDVDFRNLSRSLAGEVDELRERFRLGRADEARYFLIEVTRNCVACHSRVPKARDFPFSKRLLEKIDMEALSIHEQAQILVATREFEGALSAWEKLFEDASVQPAQMDLGGYLLDYLTVSVRVQRDAKRPRGVLRKLGQRSDTPIYLRRHIEGWVRALGVLEGELAGKPTLDRARQLVHRGNGLSEFPADRERLVYDLVASALLLRYIDQAKQSDPDLAEAFYWLGVAESRSIDTYWVPQTEFHFEVAIRLDPKGRYAADAYALLEEYITFGYGGVFGEEALPVDVWTRLEDLRSLIDGGTGGLPGSGGEAAD